MMIIIDNYDSFTYNLYQYLGELGQEVAVFRNDQITLEELREKKPDQIVISPGPGYPKQAGISLRVIGELGKEIPILGICLGHQAIGEAFGGRIVHGKTTVHGKVTPIFHHQAGLFQGVASPLKVARYHSLVVDPAGLPEALEVTAYSSDQEIMGIRHKKYPIYGLQFHPESIATEMGKQLLQNFLSICPGGEGNENSIGKAGPARRVI